MTAAIVTVGVSERTYRQTCAILPPSLQPIIVANSNTSSAISGPAAELNSVEVVWRRQHDRTAWVTALLAVLPNLRWIHTDTAGVDRLPLANLARKQIRLTNARGAHTPAVAEWALGAMLVAAKQFTATIADASAHRWVPHQEDLLLRGRTVFILGLGDIGSYLATACSALGMRVLGVSRSGRPTAGVEHVVPASGPWRQLLGEVTFLVNCLPLTRETENIVDISILEALGSPAYLINVGRGETVIEADVLAAIRSGAIHGAILDTVREEPLPQSSQLWDSPRIVISPHSSSFTDVTELRTRELFLQQIARHIHGQCLLNVVDPARGY